MNRNIVANPTEHEDEQCWRCLVCNAKLCHENPINFKKQLAMLEVFIGQHEHKDEPTSTAEPHVI